MTFITDLDRLRSQHPFSGRRMRENATAWNEADWGYLQDLMSSQGDTFRKRAFFWSNFREDVAASNVHYYSFAFSQTKHTIIFIRELAAAEGPVRMNAVFPVSYTPGTEINPFNLFIGSAGPDLVITTGVTDVVSAGENLVDYLFSAGNKSAVAGGSGLPTIYPPGFEVLVKLTNESTGTNKIKLSMAIVELEIPDDLV